MVSSDDECELVPRDVSEYEFMYGNDEPASFAELPLEWNKGGTPDGKLRKVFLRGTIENGLQKIYKQVIAWKFDLSCNKPEISVLSIDGYWIKLLKPRKAFVVIIKTILITVHFLHYVKLSPEKPLKALWDHLTKTISMLESRPSENDLKNHMSLIHEAVERDDTLAKSKLLMTFLEEKPRKRKAFNEDLNPSFIVDDGTGDEDTNFDTIGKSEDDESDDEDDCFDSVCAICDNGGRIYLCEGRCMRSFHGTPEDGEESFCESLRFTKEEEEALRTSDYYCKNCEYKKHQCFSCGELGSSDESSGAEVFRCVNGTCGYFYHPRCVAKLLHPGDEAAEEELHQKIAAGEQFACPVHRCHVCKELEIKSDKDMQFAVCRRCPRAFHVKCLPSNIAFEEDVLAGRAVIQRAWRDLIPNRILIYCKKHKINPDINTPVRNHLKFPGPQLKNNEKVPIEFSNKDLLDGRSMEYNSMKKSSSKPSKRVEKVSSLSKQDDLPRKRVEKLHEKQKLARNRSSLLNSNTSSSAQGKISLGDRSYASIFSDSEQVKPSPRGKICGQRERTQKVTPNTKIIHNSVTLDPDAKKRILTLMKDASSSITMEDIRRKFKAPSIHAQSSKFAADITLGKVEGSVQALRTALKKLDNGGSYQDAKAVCGIDLLRQVVRWKDKLRVYLAPFLHGMRYTSFGRHFTKMDKLKEIVDMLHWYIQDNDMIVDFCCGSNDFSCFMKKKLDEMGKRCSYKNYDILQPKNDFNFERRDWMSVKQHELPDGSQLIMGLNPPFGVNAALANKFINKALEFKPKLLILIVPRETQRLDEKGSKYDLIWENDQMLMGKSFYLPGSVDVNDKQIEDWNNKPPILYLWSNPEWTSKHKAIAEQHGHLPGAQNDYALKESCPVMHIPNNSEKCHKLDEPSPVQVENRHPDEQENQEDEPMVILKNLEGLPHDNCGTKSDSNHGSNRNNKRKRNNKDMMDNPSSKRSTSINLSPKTVADGSSLGTHSAKHLERQSHVHEVRDERQSHVHALRDERQSHVHAVRDERQSHVHAVRDERQSHVHAVRDERQSHVHAVRDERQSHVHEVREDHQQFNTRNFPIPPPYSQTGEDDLVRKYSLDFVDPNPSLTGMHAYSPIHSDLGFMTTTDRSIGCSGERTHGNAYRPYTNEMDQRHGRDPVFQSQVNILGREEPNSWSQRTDYLAASGPMYPTPYAQINPAANTSAMQRYAPRLDEFNHVPLNNMISGPHLPDPRGIYHHPPAPRPQGFNPGPYNPYGPHNSSGWLYD